MGAFTKNLQARLAGKLVPVSMPQRRQYAAPPIRRAPSQPTPLKIGGLYNFRHQADRLVYLGKNWSGNGYWHQFKKIGDRREVWAELLDSDLHMIEETKQ